MWEYLESTGVLERGNDEEIKAAKKAYRKIYHLNYKRSQRMQKPEFNVYFSNKNGEFGRVEQAAKKHHLTVTAFIRKSVLAYLENRYIVPDPLQVARLERVLSDCLNEIQGIVKAKERFLFEREDKYKAIEKRIELLETQIDSIFRHPPKTP